MEVHTEGWPVATVAQQCANCQEFFDIAAHVRKIVDSDADEQVKFYLVFQMLPRVDALWPPRFEWDDPNGTADEDVHAFAEALEAHVVEIKKALGIDPQDAA